MARPALPRSLNALATIQRPSRCAMSGDIEDDDISDREWDLGDTPREPSPRPASGTNIEERDALALLFTELDANGEGSVAKKRFLAAVQTARVRYLVKTSSNVQLRDLVRPGRWKGVWSDLDADGDGRVELVDFERVYCKRVRRRGLSLANSGARQTDVMHLPPAMPISTAERRH